MSMAFEQNSVVVVDDDPLFVEDDVRSRLEELLGRA
jgi:hypothetical protein